MSALVATGMGVRAPGTITVSTREVTAAAGGGGRAQIHFCSVGTTPQAATRYITMSSSAVEAACRMPVSFAGTLRNLYIECQITPAVGQTFIYTVMLEGIASTITCTINNPDTEGSDTVNTEVVVAGDRVSLRVVASATAGATRHKGGLELTPV